MRSMTKEMRFRRAKGEEEGEPSGNLYVANCGPAVGNSYEAIGAVFGGFGEVEGVYAADESGARVIVCYSDVGSAKAALQALDGRPCPMLARPSLHIRHSVLQQQHQHHRPTFPISQVNDFIPVSLEASEVNIPGIHLLHDFVDSKEEQELLTAVDNRPWKNLSKRRVQHYGYEFCYDMRNVDPKQCLGELPSFVSPILERISMFRDHFDSASLDLDQITVNEYQPGVGLSPHIDTHSAFEGLIFSLSLAGPCIMEFRRYVESSDNNKGGSLVDIKGESPNNCLNLLRRSIYLPPRSMLLLSGEARYAWHHYIPHHKIDMVNGKVIRRGSRRVSFTFRKVRRGPCQCEFPQYCDSER